MGAFLMAWFLLYGGLAAAAFSFCYIGHKKIKEGTWLYDDRDSKQTREVKPNEYRSHVLVQSYGLGDATGVL